MTKTIKKMKVPQDELDLAAALAAANARDLGWCKGSEFQDVQGYATNRNCAAMCCALGALRLAALPVRQSKYDNVTYGNDSDKTWAGFSDDDDGESLGWAFRQAMVYK